jgi:hypothetical protein
MRQTDIPEKNEAVTETSHHPIQGSTEAGKGERSFDLFLPALVKGQDAHHKDFKEQTQIFSISGRRASFPLRSQVLIGTLLKLNVHIPGTLILERPLLLSLSGTVKAVTLSAREKKPQFIDIDIHQSYKIQPRH